MDVTTCVPAVWLKNEEEWLKLLEDEDQWNKIPLLNVVDLDKLKDLTLVRFRGMIQDSYSPEYYPETYEVNYRETNTKVVKFGKYLDCTSYEKGEVGDVKASERQTFVVVSDPAQNKWVQNLERVLEEKPKIHTHPHTSQNKRRLEPETDMAMEVETPSCSNSGETSPSLQTDSPTKKQKTSATTSLAWPPTSLLSPEALLNLPIPGRPGKACHVKIYTDTDMFTLNSVFEFVGFLSLGQIYTEDDDSDDLMEMQAHYPPTSLVPRIHCVSSKKLTYYNPLVIKEDVSADRMQFIKKELLIVLTQLLLGDALAAEYLLYHLISKVYVRRDVMSLGQFSLNISNVPHFQDLDYVNMFYEFIELIVTKSHYFPMTLQNMNESVFVPKKDYDCNRLTSGLLQLSDNSHLVLDETKLAPGRLDASGVNGVKALTHVIKNQKLHYDFGFYPLEYDCDIPVLIFSEGKSMLPSDCHVVLQPDNLCISTFKEITEAAKHFLQPDILDKIRKYVTLARMGEYEISGDAQKLVEDKFISMRQNETTTGDDLHRMLILTRLVCLSEGKTVLDEASWNRASNLEESRKARITK